MLLKFQNRQMCIRDSVKLKPLKFWIHCLFNPYGFDFKEVEKILNTKRGKKCEIKKYTLYRAKDMLILSEN